MDALARKRYLLEVMLSGRKRWPTKVMRRIRWLLAGLHPARALLLALLVCTAPACSRRPPNATPEGAVREIIERLRRLRGDPNDAKPVYELLSGRTRENLIARAQRYSAASGKPITAEAMIAPSRFLPRFEPQRFSSQISGAHALVEVVGPRQSDRALVPCIYEEGGWRVDLTLPSLPPVQMRPGSGP